MQERASRGAVVVVRVPLLLFFFSFFFFLLTLLRFPFATGAIFIVPLRSGGMQARLIHVLPPTTSFFLLFLSVVYFNMYAIYREPRTRDRIGKAKRRMKPSKTNPGFNYSCCARARARAIYVHTTTMLHATTIYNLG